MSCGDRRHKLGDAGPGGAAYIVVDVVWAPTRVVSELPPGWETFKRHRSWLQGRGSRLFRGVMWKSDVSRWMWAALGGGISGLQVGREEKQKGWDGVVGS